MDKQNTGITFPLSRVECWLARSMGLVMLAMGIWIAGAIIPVWKTERFAALILLPIAVPILYYGYLLMANAFSRIRLDDTSITVYLLGKQHIVCPVEKIKLFGTAVWYYNARKSHMLAISPYSEEQLTQLQEKKLAKGRFTRGELPFMKRKGGWEQQFAKDYLLRHSKQICPQRPGKRELIFLPWEPELVALLQAYYPQIPWLQVDETASNWTYVSKDPNPLMLQRKAGEPDSVALWMILLLFGLLIPGWIVALIYPIPGMILMLSAFVVPVFLISRSKDWKTLEFSAERLQITDKQKQCHIIDSKQLQTAIKGEYLMLTTQSVSDMAQLERQYLEKTAWGRVRVAALTELSDYQQLLALRRYNRMENTRWDTTTQVLMRYSPQREQTLRQLYPHVQWLDTAVYE